LVEIKYYKKLKIMTTVINSPGSSESGGVGMIIGVLVSIIVIVLFFMYGLPALRGNQTNESVDVNVQLPEGSENSGDVSLEDVAN